VANSWRFAEEGRFEQGQGVGYASRENLQIFETGQCKDIVKRVRASLNEGDGGGVWRSWAAELPWLAQAHWQAELDAPEL
jgi:hypothetical protein